MRHAACGILLVLAGLHLALTVTPTASAQDAVACPADSATRDYWREVFARRTATDLNADTLASTLLPCLASPDSTLRDTYGYGLFTYWLRNERLSVTARRTLTDQLHGNLQAEATLLRSFSALVLSEVLRADARDAFLSAQTRAQLLAAAMAALARETDYRGLDAQLGWVHPIAHLADVLWRFALHPQLTPNQASQLVPVLIGKTTTDEANYTDNEGDRLARVLSVLLRRDLASSDQWLGWLTALETRSNGEPWATAFQSPAGMIELHNAKQFVRALDGQLRAVEISPPVRQQLDALLTLFADLV